ncbi:RrF2 family transcriptional regulator [Paenibacillus mendelii]|uniref:RrF2 family transcriptional regulator n=1 Tax=Paenibacillus mendelii TaxID=206163 RepID=A0ABV6J5U1_9BACL|nr:Rrf2 family transcriptional regulator [Paenibacillus mendelii]MCQ6559399.1 Rrf2 family transcriptional regulator [Paenibacillus mendelii]
MSSANRGVNIGPPRFKIAVHAIVWLAKSNNILSSAMIADQVSSHATFMRRVLQQLAVTGIVESRGGREGGYILRQDACQITLGDIYSAVSTGCAEPDEDVDCGEAGAQLDQELEKILYEAEQQTIDHLRQYTIADVMNRVDFFKI